MCYVGLLNDHDSGVVSIQRPGLLDVWIGGKLIRENIQLECYVLSW